SSDEPTPWWNTWIQTAKDKSTTAYEFFKKDLTEFSSTVQQDTAQAVSSTAAFVRDKLKLDGDTSVTSKAKEGFTNLLGTLSEAFSPSWDPADDELSVIHNNEVHPVDRWQACLHAILVDRNTYCHEPDSPPEVYENWLETFSLNEHRDEIAELLLNHAEVQRLYDDLVPGAVSHEEFWQRYFFRAFQLWQAEEELVNSVQQSSERLSISGVDSDQLLDSLSDPGGSKFLGGRPMVVPPNTPNAPSAEQSGSNSPTPSKATPSPAGDAGRDTASPAGGSSTPEEGEVAAATGAALATSLATGIRATMGAGSEGAREVAAGSEGATKGVAEETGAATVALPTREAQGEEGGTGSPSSGEEESSGRADLSDWEEFELELGAEDASAAATVARPVSKPPSSSEAEDDWEKWE
ncbi:unnamed protein product, partial [Ixodes hexagonus]